MIRFINQAPYSLKHKKALKEFLLSIFRKEKRVLDDLTIVFCDDEYLLELNKLHLDHDFYTDILTFDLSDTADKTIGEIYISIDRIKENAQNLKIPTTTELSRVIIHGVLHLCGYKDKTLREKALMTHKEDEYLRLLNIVPRETK